MPGIEAITDHAWAVCVTRPFLMPVSHHDRHFVEFTKWLGICLIYLRIFFADSWSWLVHR